MYKDKAKQKEKTRERVRRYRSKGVTKSSATIPHEQGVTSTEGVTEKALQIPIINALLDPKKRKMLEFVSQEIQRKSLPGGNLFYGVNGFDFTVIPELLRITANLV